MISGNRDTSVETRLRHIRRLRVSSWGLLLALFPLEFLAWFLRPPAWLKSSIIVLWFVSWAFISVAHGFSRCPACHRFFNIKAGGHRNPFTRKCLNCGVPLKCTTGSLEPTPGSLGFAGKSRVVLNQWPGVAQFFRSAAKTI